MLELVLLGPVEARLDGAHVPLAPLERSLLALLALARGTVLSTERLIDDLWGGRLPANPRSRVQGLVSSLRRKTGSAVVTRGPGYLLGLPDDACDLARCEELMRQAGHADSTAETAERLRDALRLWRGQPLEGVAVPGVETDRVRLAELRAALLEECFEAELRLGRHAELVPELVAAVAANPLRERLTGQLMTALYRSNRQAEALRTYHALRDRLVEELGSDPCADLRELHAMILRGEGPPQAAGPGQPPGHAPALGGSSAPGRTAPPGQPPRPDSAPAAALPPAQMPASVGHFLGRGDDLAALTAALPDPADEPRVLMVSGAGGIGKTALAVRWAHAVAGRFPDGQIFVDLHGSDGTSASSPVAALGAVLLALGVPAAQLPTGVEERAALYRTRLHGRCLLVVADDAGTVDHLLPLVPPTAGSLIVATSRRRLTALAAHHATRVLTLRPLPPAAARDLLREIAGPDRLRGEGAAEVVALCGGWPLALRLAGATLAARATQSLVSFADELRERVDALSVPGDRRTVGRALAETHAGVDPAAARLFDQLGLIPMETTVPGEAAGSPAGSVSLHLAAAAAGTSVIRARRLLDELISANLVLETGPDRYGFHELIGRYARHRAAQLTDRPVVEERTIRWYLATLDHAARLVDPDRPGPPVAGPAEWLPFRDGDPAAFLAAESTHLPAVARWLAGRGDPALTAQFVALAQAAGVRLPADCCALALAAARRLDDPRATGAAHARLGLALLRESARLDEAGGHLALAVELLEPGRDRLAPIAMIGLGAALTGQGRPAEARLLVERGLGLLDPSREPLACAVALYCYAELLTRSGADERGQERLAQSLILAGATLGRPFAQGWLARRARPGEEFLRRLTEGLDAPRVTPADRALARALLDLREAVVRRASIPQPGGGGDTDRNDTGRSDAGRSDAGRSDAGRSDAGQSGSGRSDAGQSGSAATRKSRAVTAMAAATSAEHAPRKRNRPPTCS
ncbi:BTAD domain-containing putative transcriptional regulator [Micromonospora sp. NPDC048830]|uniref:AfsR/SARP family transcriptional regulator n=1 Tax=Micromonospora sp. NPDC048830 TaxID=3364257 RepID=UPI003716C661